MSTEHDYALGVRDSADEKTINERQSAVEKTTSHTSENAPQVRDEAAATADESRYVTGRKLAVLFSAFLLSVFLVALDQTIVATALPKIVSQFKALDQVTWVASGYFLTQAGFMLTAGQVLSIAPTKWVYMAAITIFELGSLICGVAPRMEILILGRAVAGVGAAGIFVSVISIIAQITKLEDRPMLFGAFGAVFAVSSVIGPLMGGAFTDNITWRWCFYINLPIGGIAIVLVLLLLEARPVTPSSHFTSTGWRKWIDIDWVGTIICVGMTTSLLLPLQWGGVTHPWNSPEVYALFPVFAVLLCVFIFSQYRRGKRAILPLDMLKRRAQVGAAAEAFFLFMGILVGTYYLPLWYQGTKGHSATQSGLDILPFMLSVVVFAGLSGAVISKTHRYWPWLLLSPLLFCIGGGLLFTVDAHTSNAKIIGYQILYGCGIGGAMQNTVIAVQTEYAHEENLIPQATSIVNFLQLVGGVIGIAIAGTIFDNQLRSNIPKDLPAGVAEAVVASVTAIKTLPPGIKEVVVDAYAKSLQPVFILGVPAGIMAALCALIVPNYNIRERGGSASHAGMA